MKKRTLFLLLGALALIALILILTLSGGEKTPVSAKNAENFGALLSDLVNAYENPSEESRQAIETDLKAIRAVSRRDYQLAKSVADHWKSVFLDADYPLYLYQGDPMAPELADAGIPDSSDHAIVVLGYELMDGSMQPELVGRCETAAAVARAYPETIIVCSGGATGENNPEHHTEAGLIKAYLVENCGIEASRIFTDEEAMTTAENAVNSFRIMQKNGVHSMTIVTSVYHMRWGQAVYHLLAELYCREQRYEIRSIANYCYDVEPTVEMYRAGDRIAAFQIAGILELPKDVIRSLPSFFPSEGSENGDRPVEGGSSKENDVPDGQNPVMNFVGVYHADDSTEALVEADGMENAKITVTWAGSPWYHNQTVMSGRFDPETLTVEYNGTTLTEYTYKSDGSIREETLTDTDNRGRVVFSDEANTLTITEESESGGVDTDYAWGPAADMKTVSDPDHYSPVTAMDKYEVETIVGFNVRTAYLSENWYALADMIWYPITINGTELADADAFLGYMIDKTVSESDRKAMLDEDFLDMFVNGQGICMGSGQIWLNDPGYMTDAEPQLKIIAISGIVDK